MGSARVLESIIDLSARVDSNVGSYCYIALPDAPKGPVGEPYLVTSVEDLLDYYTTERTIKPTYNLAFFEAEQYLARSNKLYCVRPETGQLYGGSDIPIQIESTIWEKTKAYKAGEYVRPVGIPANRVSSKAYTAGEYVVVSQDATVRFECTTAGETASEIPEAMINLTTVGETVEDGTVVWTCRAMNNPSGLQFKCNAAGTSGSSEPTWPTTAGQTVSDGSITWISENIPSVTVLSEGEADPVMDHEFAANDAILIYGRFPGKDNNNIGYKIFNYDTHPEKVGEPGAFLIEVYYRGVSAPVESFICSRDEAKKDGYGQNIYVEDVLKSSMYISALDNRAIGDSTPPNPIDVLNVTYLGGGDDGDPCVDSDMVRAAKKIESKSSYPIKLLMDGGWTTPVYQKALDEIAAKRKDCINIISTPTNAENSAMYMTEIVTYRAETLNLNSYWTAMYTPHVKVYDTYNDRYLWISPSSQAAGKISEISTNLVPWYPPAGLNRGVLNNVMDVRRRFDEAQMDTLIDNQINPIAFFTGEGIVVWGQRTLYTRPSSLQELNVMLLITTIMPAIAKSLRYYLFEFNDKDTQKQITTIIDSYMETVKQQKGVLAWQTSVHASDNDVDNGILYVDLLIKPNRAINEIRFRIVPLSTGGSFEAAVQFLG